MSGSSMNLVSEDGFIAQVTGAAVQMAIMRAWNDDRRMEDAGWQTFYAADADIFALFGSPWSVALRQDARLGYGQVFDTDPEDRAIAVAERLADHVFFTLTDGAPLIVIPPIDDEIRNIINSISERLGREPAPIYIDVEVMTGHLKSLQAHGNETIPYDVLTKFATLIGLRNSSPHAEYRRLTRLFEGRRLVPAHSIEPAHGFPDEVTSLLASKRSLSEVYDNILASEVWLERILPAERSSLSAPRFAAFKRDAEALANLEAWNLALQERRIRILYITGAVNILRAGRQYLLEDDDFTRKYLRHPRYFLASPDVVAGNSSESYAEDTPTFAASEFYGWMQTFLGRVALTDEQIQGNEHTFELSPDTVEHARGVYRKDPHVGADLNERWIGYLSKLESSYEPPAEISNGILEDLRAVSAQGASAIVTWQGIRNELDRGIERELAAAWEACFLLAVKAGFFVNTGLVSAIPARHLPPVKFEDWVETERFVKQMSHWLRTGDIDLSVYENGLANVRSETKGDYEYAYYLAHATLFAARSDWRVGAILAIRAIEKAQEPHKDSDSRGHGREANFVAGHCLRHSAKSLEGYDQATEYFRRAKEIHESEVRLRDDLKIFPERFDSEIYACSVSIVLFEFFYNLVPLGRISQSAYVLREDIHQAVAALLPRIPAERELEDVALRQCANIFMLSALLGEFDDRSKLAGSFMKRTLSDDGSRNSIYLTLLVDLYDAVFEKAPTKSKIENDYQAAVKVHTIFPYDQARLGFLYDLIRKFSRKRR